MRLGCIAIPRPTVPGLCVSQRRWACGTCDDGLKWCGRERAVVLPGCGAVAEIKRLQCNGLFANAGHPAQWLGGVVCSLHAHTAVLGPCMCAGVRVWGALDVVVLHTTLPSLPWMRHKLHAMQDGRCCSAEGIGPLLQQTTCHPAPHPACLASDSLQVATVTHVTTSVLLASLWCRVPASPCTCNFVCPQTPPLILTCCLVEHTYSFDRSSIARRQAVCAAPAAGQAACAWAPRGAVQSVHHDDGHSGGLPGTGWI